MHGIQDNRNEPLKTLHVRIKIISVPLKTD
jgi:hypothetical protein